MRYGQLFGKTQKETPRDVSCKSHELLIRGGFIFQIAAGTYDFLPLGYRVLDKLDRIIKEELSKKGVQHLLMPFVHPASLWQETGRYDKIDVLMKCTSQRGSEHVLAPTHEETVTDLGRNFINSYKDLPVIVNQNQWKYRDEIRATGGLLRTREFLMQDAYSFDKDEAGLDESFKKMSEAYHAIFDRIGLPIHVVSADSGTIGGSGSEEFMMLSEVGEDVILLDDEGGYSANVEKAESKFQTFEQDSEMKPMEAVEGKGIVGVEALSKQLGVPVESTTKTMLFDADGEIVAVMIRGDYDINEIKLKNHLGCDDLGLASAEKVKEVTGAEVGYAGPVGLPEGVRVLADLTCKDRVNFEAGANKTNFHNINVNFERDFPTPEFVDVREVKEGDISPVSQNLLKARKAVELGHVFKLGTVYSDPMGANFVDSDGKQKPIEMGCYGIGITRVLAAVVEQFNDENGIVWPKSVAPYQVQIVSVGKDDSVIAEADKLYDELLNEGFEVLYDDRNERPGSKFSDADLIGVPVRLVVSQRNLDEGAVEWKERSEEDSRSVSRDDVIQELKDYYA
jgi:prolyl-tRNA synthetase